MENLVIDVIEEGKYIEGVSEDVNLIIEGISDMSLEYEQTDKNDYFKEQFDRKISTLKNIEKKTSGNVEFQIVIDSLFRSVFKYNNLQNKIKKVIQEDVLKKIKSLSNFTKSNSDTISDKISEAYKLFLNDVKDYKGDDIVAKVTNKRSENGIDVLSKLKSPDTYKSLLFLTSKLVNGSKIDYDKLQEISRNIVKVYQPLLSVKSFILEGKDEISDDIPNHKGDIKSLLYYIEKCSYTKAYDYKYFLIILILIDVLEGIYFEDNDKEDENEEEFDEKIEEKYDLVTDNNMTYQTTLSKKITKDNIHIGINLKVTDKDNKILNDISFNPDDYYKIIMKAFNSRIILGYVSEMLAWIVRFNNIKLFGAKFKESKTATFTFKNVDMITLDRELVVNTVKGMVDIIKESSSRYFNGHQKKFKTVSYKERLRLKRS